MGSLSIWHWLILSGLLPAFLGPHLAVPALVTNPSVLGPALAVTLLVLF